MAAKKTKPAAPIRRAGKEAPAAGTESDQIEMLREQNAALRDELEHARQRLQQLEEVNRSVLDRIDWVIDSLQSALPEQ